MKKSKTSASSKQGSNTSTTASPTCYEKHEDGIILRLKVQPNARSSEIMGMEEGEPPRLKIRLAAPPVDGKANKEVLSFVASELGIGKSSVRILRGEKDTHKDVLCEHVTEDQITNYLRNCSTEHG